MEKERATLEAGKKEADLYLQKERECAREQALLYQYYLYENRKEEAEVTNTIASTTSKLAETRVNCPLVLLSRLLLLHFSPNCQHWRHRIAHVVLSVIGFLKS